MCRPRFWESPLRPCIALHPSRLEPLTPRQDTSIPHPNPIQPPHPAQNQTNPNPWKSPNCTERQPSPRPERWRGTQFQVAMGPKGVTAAGEFLRRGGKDEGGGRGGSDQREEEKGWRGVGRTRGNGWIEEMGEEGWVPDGAIGRNRGGGEEERRGDLRGLMWGREDCSRGIKREKGKIGKEMGISFFLRNARITGRSYLACTCTFIHTYVYDKI